MFEPSVTSPPEPSATPTVPGSALSAWLKDLPTTLEGFNRLNEIDAEALSGIERMDYLAAWNRHIASAEAKKASIVASMATRDNPRVPVAGGGITDAIVTRIAGELCMTPEAAGDLVRHCQRLLRRSPRVFEQLADGRLNWAQVVAYVHLLPRFGPTDVDFTAELEEWMLYGGKKRQGHMRGKTPEQIKLSMRHAINTIAKEWAKKRQREARNERNVRIFPRADGMVRFTALLPALEGQALERAIDQAARRLIRKLRASGADEIPALRQARADVLTRMGPALADPEILEKSEKNAPTPTVAVVMDLQTALGLADNPAYIPGYGAIPGEVAYKFGLNATWRRWVKEPIKGFLLDQGTETYRPSKRLADYLQARDETCRMPFCHSPAMNTTAEGDHAIAFGRPGGRTSAKNMGMLCKRHHQEKTAGLWQITKSAIDGSCTFVSTVTGQIFEHNPVEILPTIEARRRPRRPSTRRVIARSNYTIEHFDYVG